MTRPVSRLPDLRSATFAALLLALSACATAPAADVAAIDRQASIEGTVVSVDTAPWAYDGNAVVTIATSDARNVRVQLPARWNLCKAPPPGDVQALKPGDRLQATGTLTAVDELVVCQQPEHVLRKQL